ncbi:methylenetetrahydrofolate dehydrogenase (NADP+) / methenyltetrahydrofolate cyclohydrolase [Cohaesibacter sp. ES.047]|uniref:bifunctional methylenetetrahydrofolate dehydrogenase/methenyltetrahydrofolate cyclohydrolase FolD n=1 Tax=Cohaesibacter sp. ES.047 TaxID=1798205 RepID=UPI000BB699E6|nr:bifunctional methylenetetrahydrofolate dehydrogenase/methenyltetrahydrofolate cyclohydrolase FolD [Cohaesibacter sp. ES.047]SNY93537.1 methylenetetrahydrofolate dehydrogenase (NADP+) / methenyltetrahydrofolate cyclohydrolase [Cohaesibacter sp. ES.047]
MTAVRIDGKAIAAELREKIAKEAETLIGETGVVPGIAVVIVGEDPASKVYVASKGKAAKECHFHSVEHALSADIGEAELLDLITKLNEDDAIHGILVQLPLPDHIDEAKVLDLIRPDKDVDGFHPINVGLLTSGARDKAMVPCTPAGTLILAKRAIGNLSGKDAVVIGRSNIVGKPMAALLLAESCTVTIAHSRTQNLEDIVRGADILVAAVGRPQMVKGDWIKEGAVVLDVGMNRIPAPERGEGKTRLVGDVDYDSAAERAGYITPVPGGIGPMTIALLMANTLTAARRKAGLDDLDYAELLG